MTDPTPEQLREWARDMALHQYSHEYCEAECCGGGYEPPDGVIAFLRAEADRREKEGK